MQLHKTHGALLPHRIYIFLLSGGGQPKPAEQVWCSEVQHVGNRVDFHPGLLCLQSDKRPLQWPYVPAQRMIWGFRSRKTQNLIAQHGNKETWGGKKEVLLCPTRFLGNHSCNCFSVPNPLALLTFSTCLISSSDFRSERADIWGGGDRHSTPDSVSSLISIICSCFNKRWPWCP